MIQLFNEDCLAVVHQLALDSLDSLVTDPPSGTGFMNQEWDKDKGGRDQWIAWFTEVAQGALGALKPGAHALVWALPRTSHWTATALENAGFEVRDVVTHHFGSGFPKSLNISKAIDQHLGAVRPVIGTAPQTGPKFKLTELTIDNGGFNDPDRTEFNLTGPGSDEAMQMEGWGTALKPGSEHWILCRKPLDGTVAANVLAYRTGGINVEGCRIGTDEIKTHGKGVQTSCVPLKEDFKGGVHTGRWPANVILTHSQACGLYCADDCPVKAMGEEARFFQIFPFEFELAFKQKFIYCPKPTVEEKEAGLESFEPHKVNDGRKTEIDNPFQRGETSRKNIHPTVKSVRLMDYLIRLITPPGGTVLDLFMGSGTTGVAAVRGQWSFIGVERSPEFFGIAQARIDHALSGFQPEAMARQKEALPDVQLRLLG